MKKNVFIILCLASMTGHAQTRLDQWHHLDPTADKTIGISTDRAYQLLKTLPAPTKPVIVAVIDGGMDLNHEDLKSVFWTNPKEAAGNGKDDDRNGHIDDTHGWNFLGGKNGQNVVIEQREETRLYTRLKPLYEGKSKASLTPAQQPDFALWEVVKPYFEQKQREAIQRYQADLSILKQDSAAIAQMKQVFGVTRLDTALLHHPPTTDSSLIRKAQIYYKDMIRRGYANDDIDSYQRGRQRVNEYFKARVDCEYNPQYSPRSVIGDNPTDLTEYTYGNADLITPLTDRGIFHGTHVAGIIGADRANSLGVKGIADHVQVLSVRAIPNGDERDKDVANAIRYAVDNGARIINMSFGKYFSPDKAVVDEAIRYADRKGVLLIHAAGNDQLDLDSAQQFPTPKYLNGETILNLITVGASDRSNDNTLAAVFSNYGSKTVDVFAPGVAILSTAPDNKYELASGTSMATPVVAGIAAVLKSYFPNLNPADLKRIISQSAVPYHTQVLKPGTKQKVDFATLSKTGGIVNLYEAVKLAMTEQTRTAKK